MATTRLRTTHPNARLAISRTTCRQRGVSMIELAVALSALSLLIAGAIPAMSRSRAESQQLVCARHLHQLGQGFARHASLNSDFLPPSYVYPNDAEGNYDLYSQDPSRPYGYRHWSRLVFAEGDLPDETFTCPSILAGGHPRTNPGSNPSDWELQQVDQNQQSPPASLTDRQVPRIAYIANGALVPWNKFTQELGGGPRVNRLVRLAEVQTPGRTILLTELLENWKGAARRVGGSLYQSRAHRSIYPFYHLGAGYDPYSAQASGPGFLYSPTSGEFLLPYEHTLVADDLLEGHSGLSPVNVVGRQHPGGENVEGGTANFLFLDGSLNNRTIRETMINREWGDRFYSITGENEVF
jgi:prepilin-type N-terminal cleavage/methylation domain-containing protein/prepilin-type processing-associated H-X9-DG protein